MDYIRHDKGCVCDICTLGASIDASKDQLALAKIGITALVDEATRYQEVRPKAALKDKLREYKNGSKT